MNSVFRLANHCLRQAAVRVWQARRAPGVWGFALIWLTVFCTPFLRVCFQVQTSRDSLSVHPASQINVSSDTFSLQRLHRLYPNDRAAQLACASLVERSPYPPFGATFDHHNALLRQYPNDAVVVASWLRRALENFQDERISTTATKVFYSSLFIRSTGSSTYTASELQQAITLSQQGQKLEPDNSFFDYALLYFLLCDKRDDEALRVLHSASLKPRYDDHLCDELAASLKVREYVRPLLIEEKEKFVAVARSPQVQQDRVAQFVSWLAWQKQQQGDVLGDVSIRGDMARFFAVAMRGRVLRETSFWAREAIQTAWRCDLTPFLSGSSSTRRVSSIPAINATAFAQFAAFQRRPDLARETLQIMRDYTTSQNAERNLWGNSSSLFLRYTWLGIACLFSLVFLPILYVALSGFLLFSKPGEVPRRDIWPVVAVSSSLSLFAFWLFCDFLNVPNAGGYFPSAMLPMRSQDFDKLGLVPFFAAPVLLSALWCAVSAWWRARQSPEKERQIIAPGLDILRKALLLVWGSALIYAVVYSIVVARRPPTYPAMTSMKANALMPGFSSTPLWENLPLVWTVVAALSLLAWCFYARRLTTPPRTHAIYGLRRFRQVLLAFVPVFSALWVFIALLSLSQRHIAETRLNVLLQHGALYAAQHQATDR